MAHTVQTPAVPTVVAVAPVADPGPLGLSCFALTTFVLSAVNADLIPASVKTIVLSLALFYGGITQVIAGIWEFRKNNTIGATAFCSYGAFWMAYWGLSVWFKPAASVSADDKDIALGFFLLGWTIFTLILTVAVAKTNGALLTTFLVLDVTFILLAAGHFTHSAGLEKLGGWLGIITALCAWYTGGAGVINETWKRTVVPIWKI